MNDLNWSQTSDTGAAGCLATRQDATISFGIFVQQSRNSVLLKIFFFFFFLPAQSWPCNSLRWCIIKNDASVLSLASSMGMKKRAEILLVNHILVLMCSVFYNKFQLSFLSQTSVWGGGKSTSGRSKSNKAALPNAFWTVPVMLSGDVRSCEVLWSHTVLHYEEMKCNMAHGVWLLSAWCWGSLACPATPVSGDVCQVVVAEEIGCLSDFVWGNNRHSTQRAKGR